MCGPGVSVKIREFRPGDYNRLIALWHACGLPLKPFGRDQKKRLLRELKQNSSRLWVAFCETELAGSVLATHDGRKGWINRMAVNNKFRKQGIARLLLNRAHDYFSGQGLLIVACLVEKENRMSLDFFLNQGYELQDDIVYLTRRKSSEA